MDKNTIYLNFVEIVAKYEDKTALAYFENGKYKKISYKKLNFLVLKLVSYFNKLGLKNGDRICILSENRWEWPVIDLACNYLGIVLVPIHSTYGQKYIDYIVSQTSPKIIFISNQKLFDNFKKIERSLVNNLLEIILFDQIEESDLKFKIFQKVLDDASVLESIKIFDNAEDVMTIIFTSGTTGMPKGAMLSNRNIISDIKNVLKYVPIYASDRFFSILTLSHVLERTAGQMVPFLVGASIYYSRSPKTLIDDIKLARPTIFICVPRIFERVFDKIQDNIRNGSKFNNKIFFYALRAISRFNSLKRNGKKINGLSCFRCKIFDKIVFEKIRKIFGGRLRVAISGGSSLDKRVARFFEDVGVKIIEGYGLTETSPIISVNKINNYKFGTVGFGLENLELKINKDKEILVRGDSVMSGYWKDEKSTKEAIDEDGWFYTGDLGFVDQEGFLNIIGRKKEILVLSTGKNIVPVNIEQALNYDKFINQSIVIGNNEKFLTALIVPDFQELKIFCQDNKIEIDNENDYLNLEIVKSLYRERVSFCLKDFASYEQIVDFAIIDRQFDEEHDELTPTLKLKRDAILMHFKNIINKLLKNI